MVAAESSIAARRALDELYRNHSAEVYRYAYAVLGNHADAEDVTQTTFVNALRALERGERPRKPSNWLITITHNIVRQRFRQQQARPSEVELSGDLAREEGGEATGPTMSELVKALQRIPSSQREALVLRELEGRSYNEIAEALSLSTSALETLLFRARRSLADELENAATCERAQLDLSRQFDGRLSRKEKRRLTDHLAECQSCSSLQATQGKHRKAFKGLALLPLPFSLTFFKGAPSASAATGLPTIGGGVVAGASTTGGGMTFGGLALGGVAMKVAAVIAAVSVVGVGYVETTHLREDRHPAKPSPTISRVPAGQAALALRKRTAKQPTERLTKAVTARGAKTQAPSSTGAASPGAADNSVHASGTPTPSSPTPGPDSTAGATTQLPETPAIGETTSTPVAPAASQSTQASRAKPTPKHRVAKTLPKPHPKATTSLGATHRAAPATANATAHAEATSPAADATASAQPGDVPPPTKSLQNANGKAG